ncbi:T9SS type A sorting domain-containing protein [Flavobacterium sp. MAH-1]|uniref:T9SS type A sorting domain-containing protein n=1 Tax=Flavobacterium agri TaxID=2743471 RepID=A0A7Y8Y1G0_9FLAO|nr:ELWxxDGT repeat protein [Flavobacterium agri]NUY80651.1 T9SS type A sorting domain-containing protein [Flavobacterium agri]NYA70675.1 T9SS type A sorting domain-containing protein [Flavobacterium agri]
MKRLLQFWSVMLVSVTAIAQVPYMVKDINSTAYVSYTGNPQYITEMGGNVYFSAKTYTSGTELWKSNGTSWGTTLLKEIAAGATSSDPKNLTKVGNTVFFSANTTELWKTDGTTAGTVLVKSMPSDMANFKEFGGNLIFSTSNGLWKSDGTEAGTTLLLDGTTFSMFTIIDSIIYFACTKSPYGNELWKTDGTPAGTLLVKDINPGTSGSGPFSLTVLGSTLFFGAADATHGNELWKSDGTEAGTVMLTDLYTSGNSVYPNIAAAGGVVYFSGSSNHPIYGGELWKSDGTPAGTVLVKDIRPGSLGSNPGNFIERNGLLYFSADNASDGRELWKSDGTETGTVMVSNIYSGAPSSDPQNMKIINGTLYFSALGGANDRELWTSDGTTAGTVVVKDINPGASSNPAFLSAWNGQMIFAADGGQGIELWKTDGTAVGTKIVKDIYQDSSGSNIMEMVAFNGASYFWADDGVHGFEVWKSDGTEAGTVLLKDIYPGMYGSTPYPSRFVPYNGMLYFSAANDTHGIELWKTDGTEAGTVMAVDISVGGGSSNPQEFAIYNNLMYFQATAGDGEELWKSDGTPAGTSLVKDIEAGWTGSSPKNLTVVGNTLYFSVYSDTDSYRSELWKSDGTTAGTVFIKLVSPTEYSEPSEFRAFNGALYFVNSYPGNGMELWKSDGTASGTILLKDIWPGSTGGIGYEYAVLGNYMYFNATSSSNNQELWRTDGTTAGTVLFADINPSGSSSPTGLMTFGGNVYFTATNPTNGQELYKTDGTITSIVKEIVVGPGSSNAGALFVHNGELHFTALNPAGTNRSLWKTDGTEAGTVLLSDQNIEGGPFVSTGSKIFFQRDYFSTSPYIFYSAELWALGNCAKTNAIETQAYTSQTFNVETQAGTESCHCNLFNKLLASLDATGANPVSGTVVIKQWIESDEPAGISRRHHEIKPSLNPDTATGKVTLYFSQADFDSFNLQMPTPSSLLPQNPSDSQGISNLRIGHRKGQSSDTTGLPNSYVEPEISINPEDSHIIWNASQNRWEVSFETTGFGGFWVNTVGCEENTYYADTDADGFGDATSSVTSCIQPENFVLDNTDCDDSSASVHPGSTEIAYNGIDEDCNGTIDDGSQVFSQVLPSQCGTTLSSIGTLIGAVSHGSPVNGYRFKVVNNSDLSEQTIDRNVPNFQLTQLPNYDYAATYTISVMLKRNGIWLNYYGPSCQISTPAILDPGGSGAIDPSQCNTSLASLSTLIATTSLAGVTQYRFRVTNLTDPVGANAVQVLDRNQHWFSLTMLARYNYGTTYQVEVAVKTNGSFSNYGSACTISSPTVPMLIDCNAVINSAGTLIATSSVSHASSYRFEVTNMSSGNFETTVIDRTQNWFTFHLVPNFTPSAEYAVRVAVNTAGSWSPFGESCTITAPGAARQIATDEKPIALETEFSVLAYPNPYSNDFRLDLESAEAKAVEVKIYDTTGRLIAAQTVAADEIENLEWGKNLPSGVYTVSVLQGIHSKTLRVIKR